MPQIVNLEDAAASAVYHPNFMYKPIEERKPFVKVLANWTINDLQSIVKKKGIPIEQIKLTPDDFRSIVLMHWMGFIDRNKCRQMIEERI